MRSPYPKARKPVINFNEVPFLIPRRSKTNFNTPVQILIHCCIAGRLLLRRCFSSFDVNLSEFLLNVIRPSNLIVGIESHFGQIRIYFNIVVHPKSNVNHSNRMRFPTLSSLLRQRGLFFICAALIVRTSYVFGTERESNIFSN